MAETLDQQVGHGMVQITTVNHKGDAKENRNTQHDFLTRRDFGAPLHPIQGGTRQFALFVVGSKTDTFNKAALGAVVLFTIKQVIHELQRTLGGRVVNAVAHGRVGVVEGRIVRLGAINAATVVEFGKDPLAKAQSQITSRDIASGVLDTVIVIVDRHFDAATATIASRTHVIVVFVVVDFGTFNIIQVSLVIKVVVAIFILFLVPTLFIKVIADVVDVGTINVGIGIVIIIHVVIIVLIIVITVLIGAILFFGSPIFETSRIIVLSGAIRCRIIVIVALIDDATRLAVLAQAGLLLCSILEHDGQIIFERNGVFSVIVVATVLGGIVATILRAKTENDNVLGYHGSTLSSFYGVGRKVLDRLTLCVFHAVPTETVQIVIVDVKVVLVFEATSIRCGQVQLLTVAAELGELVLRQRNGFGQEFGIHGGMVKNISCLRGDHEADQGHPATTEVCHGFGLVLRKFGSKKTSDFVNGSTQLDSPRVLACLSGLSILANIFFLVSCRCHQFQFGRDVAIDFNIHLVSVLYRGQLHPSNFDNTPTFCKPRISCRHNQHSFFSFALLPSIMSTSSNADKFLEAAATFPPDALPNHLTYQHPLVERYATKEMSFIWSPAMKFTCWRKLWTALATAEQELGLDISDEQLEEMRQHLYDVDFDIAAKKEAEFRHDVMGHVHAFGSQAPNAMPVIHLGATSCFVGDNTDLLQLRDALKLIRTKLVKVISILKDFSIQYKDLPTLGFTHYQPAQLTTVGKRATLWCQDLILDLERLDREIDHLPMRGVKGTTGTQASFLELFDGDHDKVKALNKRVCELMGFPTSIAVSGQTYTRKIEYYMLTILSGIAQSAYKMCGDIRLLANLKEVEEPFSKTQIGSSAMAYKRNPMRSERVCSLARYVMNLPDNCAQTHANQWLERTLDDSAIRRIVLPEAFLGTDVILNLLSNIADGLHVWPEVVKTHVMAELPFMATENILMECVKAGGDRQDLHEEIRVLSMQAGKVVKAEGKANDLLSRIQSHPKFSAVHDHLDTMMDPIQFVGRAPQQVEEFVAEVVDPILEQHKDLLEVVNVDDVNL